MFHIFWGAMPLWAPLDTPITRWVFRESGGWGVLMTETAPIRLQTKNSCLFQGGDFG